MGDGLTYGTFSDTLPNKHWQIRFCLAERSTDFLIVTNNAQGIKSRVFVCASTGLFGGHACT